MDPIDDVRARYRRFALDEAPGRSALYVTWAHEIANDDAWCAALAELPSSHRQPPVVFAVARRLGAPETSGSAWRSWMRKHREEIIAEAATRLTQTNEPRRAALLLPLLAEIEGPIALLEIGASAGACLYPDRYSYRFLGARQLRLDPEDGASAVALDCDLRGGETPPLRMPEIVWRGGIDLLPLDARDSADRSWLMSLVWPGETARAERLSAALDIVAEDPPRFWAGNARDLLEEAVNAAPSDATLVITTPGVLVHIPRAERTLLIDAIRKSGARWITLDAPELHDAWTEEIDRSAWRGGFALALDGVVKAAADPLGRWIEWGKGADLPAAERALLDFEERWPRHSGEKEEAIRSRLDMTPGRYYQLLTRVLQTSEAQAYRPQLVARLRRRLTGEYSG